MLRQRDGEAHQGHGSRNKALSSQKYLMGLRLSLRGTVKYHLRRHLMCRFGHTIQTLETEVQLTFNVSHLQLPCGWKFSDLEEFRLTVLVTESDSEDWSDFVTLLKEWVNAKVTPWDQSSVVYQYHRARFQHDFLSTKLEELSGRPAFA